MIYKSEKELLGEEGISVQNGKLKITDEELFIDRIADNLSETILFGESEDFRQLCCSASHAAGSEFGIFPSSIQALYRRRAQKGIIHFTVPAINIRTLTFESARAVFRAADKLHAGAFLFELARSEMSYTDQRPWEYSSLIILAAIKERFSGPIFIQGDHFQVNQHAYAQDKAYEIDNLKALIVEAIKAGFFNIDIDSSTLVDLTEMNIDKQQRLNIEVCAELTGFIRENQPQGVDISVGGEIGEVGGKNSTLEELHTFMHGYLSAIGKVPPISKISVQTGTSHGGVVKPDGTIANVKIDFNALKALSQMARTEFGLAGAVQHGASTLPKDSFSLFPLYECAEIHLATQFQNIVYDLIPKSLSKEINDWLHLQCAEEKTAEMTESQFIYKTRKKAFGPFKRQILSLPVEIKEDISLSLEKEFLFLFEQLNVRNTKDLVTICLPTQ